ncbi:hypothetical protein GQ53DRAFT_743378 [Thozetella sp. PMI_491]|nr:hypothetical protein GQ53DRAFT_743378 [Thozetella sp. PMI_491]
MHILSLFTHTRLLAFFWTALLLLKLHRFQFAPNFGQTCWVSMWMLRTPMQDTSPNGREASWSFLITVLWIRHILLPHGLLFL